MKPSEMIAMRKSGVAVKDIIALSGASERHVYSVMKDAGLATHVHGAKSYVVTVTRVDIITVEAMNKAEAEILAMGRYPDAIRARAEVDR